MATTQVVYDIVARDNASRTMDAVGASAGRLEAGLGKLGGALVNAAKIGAVAAVGIGVASVKMAADFQTQMTRVQTGAGEFASNMKLVNDGVLAMSGQVGVSAKSLASGLYTVESAGYHGADALEVLKNSAMGAKVGAADLTTVTDAVTTALNAYKMGADDTSKVVNALVATEAEGKTNLEDLAGSLSKVLPIAATAKVGLNEVLGAMATMTAQGTPAADAATYLKQTIGQLANPTAKAASEMKSLGLDSTAVSQNLGTHGLASTLTMLTDAIQSKMGPAGLVLIDKLKSASGSATAFQKVLANLPPTQQTYVAALADMTGGTKSMQAALELSGPHMQDFLRNTEGINEHVQAGGKSIEGWAAVQGTFNQKLSEAKDALGALAIKVGEEALPVLTKFMGFVAETAIPKIENLASKVSEKLKPAFDTVDSVVKGLSGKQSFGTGAQADIENYADTLRTAFSQKFSGIAGDIKTALTGIDLSGVAKDFATDAKSWADSLIGGVKTGVEKGDWKPLGKTVGKSLVDSISGFADLTGKVFDQIGKALSKVDWLGLGIDAGKQAPSLVAGLFLGIMNVDLVAGFKQVANHWFDALVGVIGVALLPERIASKIGEVLLKIPLAGKLLAWMFDAMRSLGKGLLGLGEKALKLLGEGLLTGIRKVIPDAGSALARELALLPTRLGVAVLDMLSFGERIAKGLGDGLGKGIGWVGEQIGKVIGYVVKPFYDAGGWLFERGRSIVEGLKNGVVDVARSVGAWTKTNVIDPIVAMFVDAGTWLWAKGSDLVTGLKSGVVDGAKAIGGWTKATVIDPVVGAFADAGSWLWSKGSAAVGGLKNGVVDGAKGIAGWTKATVIDPAVSVFSNAGSWLYQAGGDILSGLKNGIADAIRGIGDWVKANIVDPVVNAVKRWFGINSPSTVMAELGGHLTSGLMLGMAQQGGTAIAKLVFGDLPSALEHLIGKGLVSLAALPAKALSALAGLGGKAADFISGLFGGGGGATGQFVGLGTQAIGQSMAAAYGWTGGQWDALRALWTGESGWNTYALNASSGAYGIPQSLPASKMAAAGPDWRTNPATQIKWGLDYIRSVYGSPAAAYGMWLSRSPHWYDSGGFLPPGLSLVANGLGRSEPTAVFTPGQWATLHQLANGGAAGGEQQPVQVHVHVRDEALLDLIHVEIEGGVRQLAAAVHAGGGWS